MKMPLEQVADLNELLLIRLVDQRRAQDAARIQAGG